LFDTCSFCYIKAELAYFRNDRRSAYAYYDTLRILLDPIVRPENKYPHMAYYHAYLGIAYAGLGMHDHAIEQGKQALERLPVSMDAVDGPSIAQFMAEIYARSGEYEAAMDKLELLLTIPSYVSVPLLRIDPLWDPLRDHPRFQRLLDKYSRDRL
jgi:tetratricopeptide (TPR) repeat protein